MVTNDGPSAEGLVGPLEYDVMSVLWATGTANVPVVLERVNASRREDKALAYTTVMTVLARLHEKGLLSRERRGRGYEYRPRFDEAELVAHLSRREVDGLLARYGHVALAQFAVAVDEADPALLHRIRALARDDDA
jgi:predicted transcriptional regulator